MVDIVKGLTRMRFLVSKTKKIDKSVLARLSSNRDANVKELLEIAEADGIDIIKVLTELKKTKGTISDAQAKKLGFDPKIKRSSDGKKPKKITTQSDSPKKAGAVKLIVPTSIVCPDQDDDGNEVFLVIGKDGLLGCASLIQEPVD